MTFVFEPSLQTSIAVVGEDARFPVRRVFCVGRNYAAHAREMGKDPERDPPFFFTKPADAAFDAGTSDNVTIPYPPETDNFHYEIELTVAIEQDGINIAVDKAVDHVFGYATSIDLTRRDLQLDAREKGRPWDWGKAFDLSAPIAPLHRVSDVGHKPEGRIWLSVDGDIKQDANLSELIWPTAEIISIISHSMELKAGDLIMTGTPAGVGPILAGQHVVGGIAGLTDVSVTIGDKG
ncbi:MAG: fumarylacetoacetate hydrolase family protein [Rhizobiaceae bacterium]|nr:fumarylacetoacetate hydrolase family protein [Rhizobiaceae bacterium]